MRATLGILAIALGAPTACGSLVLDTFDAIPGDDFAGPRTIIFDPTEANPLSVSASADVRTDLGAFVYETGPEAAPSARIVWNNDGAGLNLDLDALLLTGLELDFGFVDQDFTIFFEIEGGADGAELRYEDRISASNAPQTFTFNFASFGVFGEFDPSDVDVIKIEFNSSSRDFPRTEALDFTLTEVRAVPAPASIALLGVAGLASRRKR